MPLGRTSMTLGIRLYRPLHSAVPLDYIIPTELL